MITHPSSGPRRSHAARRWRAGIARALLACLAGWSGSATAGAQEEQATARELERGAIEALRAEEYALASERLEAALALRPGHPRLLYNLTCSYALEGRRDDALGALTRLADMGVDFGSSQDTDLAGLHDDPRWAVLEERFAALEEPTRNGEVTLTLSRWDFLPEGIAHDAATGRFFIGSMRDGSILAIEQTGEITRFGTCAPEGRLACVGLAVDPERQVLWAAACALDTVEGYTDADKGATAILGFDLSSGERTHLGRMPERHPAFGFNDLTVAPNGDIYVGGGGVYRVAAGEDVPRFLEIEGPGEPIDSAGGIAITPDGATLYVAVYAIGVAVVNLADLTYTWLDHGSDVTLQGIDGLYFHDGDLVAVQNGVRPWRIVRLDLAGDGRRVTAARVLERARPLYAEPMTGVIVGDEIHVVGRGPRPDTSPSHVTGTLGRWLGETIILRVPLETR